jgi:hypothetical protein
MASLDQKWWNRRTQVVILVGGLIVWGGAVYWRVTEPGPAAAPPGGETKGDPGRKGPLAPERKGLTKAEPLPELRLDLLERPLPPLKEEAKNLFAPVLLAPPPPPPRPQAAAPPAPDPFLEEARRLRVVAVMQEDGQPVAFIADGNEVHSVRKNDLIRARILIKELAGDFVVVSMPNGDKEVRLTLAPSGGGPGR